MFAAVGDFLTDEPGDLGPELRVGDPVAVVAHGTDEEVLALRKTWPTRPPRRGS